MILRGRKTSDSYVVNLSDSAWSFLYSLKTSIVDPSRPNDCYFKAWVKSLERPERQNVIDIMNADREGIVSFIEEPGEWPLKFINCIKGYSPRSHLYDSRKSFIIVSFDLTYELLSKPTKGAEEELISSFTSQHIMSSAHIYSGWMLADIERYKLLSKKKWGARAYSGGAAFLSCHVSDINNHWVVDKHGPLSDDYIEAERARIASISFADLHTGSVQKPTINSSRADTGVSIYDSL